MKINSLDGLLGKTASLKQGTVSKGAKPSVDQLFDTKDKVDVGPMDGLKLMSIAGQNLMADFQKAVVDTLPTVSQGGGMADINNLLSGSPLDKFIKNRFANTPADTKKEFMNYFESYSRSSGGLVPSKVLSNTFGSSGGYPDMIASITDALSKYM